MPFINGRYYMNPAYGRALEAAREAEERNRRLAQLAAEREADPDSALDEDGHWITKDHRHILIDDPQRHRPQARINRRPGTRAARIIYNETAGLRGDPDDLHDARVAIAHTLQNSSGLPHPPSTVTDELSTTAAKAILADPTARAAWADSQAAVREAAQTHDDTLGATHLVLDYAGLKQQQWETADRETATYGPFHNGAGGGDVPRGAPVTIRIYREKPRW